MDIQPWQVLDSSIAFSNRWIRIRRDICRTNRGNIIDYYVTERNSYVMIVAITPASQVLLVRQYKHGVGKVIHELPAGYLEEGEDPSACASRELREETGYRSERILPLGAFATAPSSSAAHAHIFLALDAEYEGEPEWDPNEKIQVQRMDLAQAVALALKNEFFHDVSSTLSLVLAWQHIHGPCLPTTG